MIIFLVLGVLFCTGIAVALCWSVAGIYEDFGLFGGILAAMIFGPMALVILLLPIAFYTHEQSPDLVTLKKSAWACTASHQTTTYVSTGKTIVPVFSTVCDQYGRLQ